MAIYDDATQTIYLPEGWQGVKPAKLSILVHEMVHHMQSLRDPKGKTGLLPSGADQSCFDPSAWCRLPMIE